MKLKLTVTERILAHQPIHALSGNHNPATLRIAFQVLDALEFTAEERAKYLIKDAEEIVDGRRISSTVWGDETANEEMTIEMKPVLVKWLARQILGFSGYSQRRELLDLFDKMEAAQKQVEEDYGADASRTAA